MEACVKVLIVGAGGVGGYHGGLLSMSGEEVTLLARGEHLRAIKDNGLRVKSELSGDFTVHPMATDKPDGSWKAELALFCVKGYHNENAIKAMAPAVGEDTDILTLQNGIGAGAELADAFGNEKVILGATYIDGWVEAPGVVAEGGGAWDTVFGEPDGEETARSTQILDMFTRAGIETRLTKEIQDALWAKLLMICGLSGMSCITYGSIEAVFETPETREMTRRIMMEVETVGLAKGAVFEDGIVDWTLEHLHENRKTVTSSMFIDMKAGKPLEVGVLNGAVSKAGREVGVDTPVNDFITACLSVVDARARAAITT